MPFLTADTAAEYDADMSAEETTPETELVVLGEGDTSALVVVNTQTGEVVHIEDAPSASASDAKEIANWLGPRLSAASARLAGLEAEKAAWLAKVSALYDARIKREKSYIDYLKGQWEAPLRLHAADLLQYVKNRRSVVVGMLTLAFKKKQGKRNITNEAVALDYLGRVCPNAIKVSHSVLVSRIPDALIENLPADCGLEWVPPNDEFEVR